MTTSTAGAFRYAGLAALPIVLTLAFAGSESARREAPSLGHGPQVQTECLSDVAQAACPDAMPTNIAEIPQLGELTVTAPRRGLFL
ncbi:MAG TPA: hypothetical protein VKB41_11735 [Steroidobacteraceae bacterium]|jgi:hypothetical protein|nr:hypothetical protein [Steroidobacteraceae bacterium]